MKVWPLAGAPLLAFVLLLFGGCAEGPGQLCGTHRPCERPLTCRFPSPGAEQGVCDYEPLGFGERCEGAEACADELTCSSHFTPGERYGTCIFRRQAGEPCTVGRDCVSKTCDGSHRCVP